MRLARWLKLSDQSTGTAQTRSPELTATSLFASHRRLSSLLKLLFSVRRSSEGFRVCPKSPLAERLSVLSDDCARRRTVCCGV